MANKKKKSQLSNEGKTELAKAIADKGQTFARTYANIENSVAKFFRWLSGWVDKILFNQRHGKTVALVFALLFFAMVNVGNDKSNLFDTSNQTIEINDIPVSVVVSDQAYEVSGLPEKVNANIVGDLSDLQLVKSQGNYQVVADLSDFTEGTHEVTLQPKNISSRVKVNLDPPIANVTIKKKISKRFNLGYDFVNTSKMDNIYALGEPEFEQGEVVVRASEDTISQIAFVKALIDVSGVNADFETDAQLVAYDQAGKIVKVDIMPKTMKAKVAVTTPNKNVPIQIIPVGVVPNGKAIASYTLDNQAVTIYGPQNILEKISELPISIPASTLTSDMSIPMPIVLPNGVTKASLKVVNINIKLEDVVSREISDVPVLWKNKADDLVVSLVNDADSRTTVVVKGAQKVIDAIVAGDIEVYVDLEKVTEPGTQSYPLRVVGKDKLATYELNNATIDLVITKK